MGMQRVRHGAKDNYWQPVILLTLWCRVITQPHGKISMRRCALRPQGALCHGVITTFLARPSPLSRDRRGICNTNGASRKKKLSKFNIRTRFVPNLAPQWKHCGPHKALKVEHTCVESETGAVLTFFGHRYLWLQITPRTNLTWKLIQSSTRLTKHNGT